MSLKQISPIRQAWYRWKMLRLPWRRQILVGFDLEGRTYWERRDARAAELGRVRRIVRVPRGTPYADVAVPPAWHQWLRHIRPSPPSLDEQRADVQRRERIRALAAAADARWANAAAALEAGAQQQSAPTPQSNHGERGEGTTASSEGAATAEAGAAKNDVERQEGQQSSPWPRVRPGPGEDWQPKAWDPTVAGKR